MKIFKIVLHLVFVIFLQTNALTQITISPVNAKPEEAVTLTFDASQGNGELKGVNQIYMHHGVVTDKIDGTAWKYVKGNWGKDDGIGKMTKVSGSTDKWQIILQPSVRSYFSVPTTESIFRISAVFRNADGSKKGTANPGSYAWGTISNNQDYFINLFNDNTVYIDQPLATDHILSPGQTLNISAQASSNVSTMNLAIDEGSGYVIKASVMSGKTISYLYSPLSSGTAKIRVTAILNGVTAEHTKTLSILVKKPNIIAALPPGLKQGVNYNSDSTKATLVLLAPEKQTVHVVGDFNNWSILDTYQMNQSPDGKYFWLEINNLVSNKAYVYQYWIDGSIKIGDPYGEQTADPWNDKWIEQEVFPNLPSYTMTDFGIASVLQTKQTKYQWGPTETTYKRPDVNHLAIYELHIRDFIAAHSFNALRDTLSYLKKLGINAIELMPINEFEGNDSWGYNPSYFFAVDKYYGHKNALKRFIEEAHKQGMAVIMDIVLNHSFGESPMVKMYFDQNTGKPAANNPWYNREYVGQYQWGYDFNHESEYTRQFVDDVNRFWLQEFHFDGFRFDFTKGFTNYAPNNNVDGYDASRIAILKRMNQKIKEVDPKAYVILEHWAPANEEQALAADGMKMWRNKTYDYVQSAIGSNNGSFANAAETSHVPLYGSHDEQRVGYHCLTEGYQTADYDIKNKSLMLERTKMKAAFYLLQPGPKMIWQFDELGYDIDINFNGRVGRKPLVWGTNSLKYYDDIERQYVYTVYSGLLDVRNTIGPSKLATASTKHKHTGNSRRLAYDTDDIDLMVLGNIDTKVNSMDYSWIKQGWWYDYFSGDSINVTNTFDVRTLAPGEWHIYTSKRLSKGFPGAVAVYSNPVTVTPFTFKANQQIKIRFEAKKADPKNTAGLVNAQKVFMHAGVKYTETQDNSPNDIVRSFPNYGEMTEVSPDIWEISLVPNNYFGVANDKSIREINMWFRDESGNNLGYGFRGSVVSFSIISDAPILTIDPESFKANTEITITFDAAQGNRELVGSNKIYMHSGVGIVNTQDPASSAWNKVKGNWGQDDGVGLMTKVAGTEKWQIKLTPSQYYGITSQEVPYWIAAVFRSADGSKKATATPGPMSNGFIANNLDYFIRNNITVDTDDDSNYDRVIKVKPNPTFDNIEFSELQNGERIEIMDISSRLIYSQVSNGKVMNVNLDWAKQGYYIYRLMNADGKVISTGKVLKL
jgi:1,4-alpha-glucan branching enzyme